MSSFPTPGIAKGRPVSLAANVVGTKPAGSPPGLEIIEHGGPYGRRATEFKFTNCPIVLVDNGATGSGSLQLYDLPACLTGYAAAIADLTYTCVGFTDAGLVSALGGIPAAADGTLVGNEATYIASTATAMSGGAGTNKMKAATAQAAIVDGTAGGADVFLNIASANDPVGNKTILVNGSILFHWENFGDN